ncbi:uncharacterized protein LOC144924027 [Branchiostoma floridae x Branchiostoma belcheri]
MSGAPEVVMLSDTGQWRIWKEDGNVALVNDGDGLGTIEDVWKQRRLAKKAPPGPKQQHLHRKRQTVAWPWSSGILLGSSRYRWTERSPRIGDGFAVTPTYTTSGI